MPNAVFLYYILVVLRSVDLLVWGIGICICIVYGGFGIHREGGNSAVLIWSGRQPPFFFFFSVVNRKGSSIVDVILKRKKIDHVN